MDATLASAGNAKRGRNGLTPADATRCVAKRRYTPLIVKEVFTFDMVGYLTKRFNHPPRTPGLHVSQIYGDLDKFINKDRYKNGLSETQLAHFATVGFLWERILEDTLADIAVTSESDRYFRPGEQLFRGLLLTPDYADIDFYGDGSGVLGLEEWKANWKSFTALDNLEKNFWRWIVQQKAYCLALGVNVSRLRVLSIVGNWRDDITPRCRVFEFEFSDQELEENWSMLFNHATRKGWITHKYAAT